MANCCQFPSLRYSWNELPVGSQATTLISQLMIYCIRTLIYCQEDLTTNQNKKAAFVWWRYADNRLTSALLPFSVYPAAQPLQGTDFHGIPLEYFRIQPTTYLSESPIIGMIQSWTKLKHTMRITLLWFSRQITTRSYRLIRQSCDECVLVWSGVQESNLY